MTLKKYLLLFLITSASYASSQELSFDKIKNHYKSSHKGGCIKIYRSEQEELQQIILIRHGEPDLKKNGWTNRKGAMRYSQKYDQVGIKSFEVHPFCEGELFGDTVFHSTLERAKNTADRLFREQVTLVGKDDFIEFERKIFVFPNIPLPLKFWTSTSRIFWILGFNDRGIENFKKAKKRAKKNAEFLEEYSRDHGEAILVAHGLHNKFVLKSLKKKGWKHVRSGGSGYLSIQILAKEPE
ncbi:MAG: histidine phosphatase family protein [Bacteroidota bacterium]